MEFKITRFITCESNGSLKAFCDVAAGERLLIRGIRVVQGRKGPFVSMPRQQSRNGKWYDSVVPVSKHVRAELSRIVLEAFYAHTRRQEAIGNQQSAIGNQQSVTNDST